MGSEIFFARGLVYRDQRGFAPNGPLDKLKTKGLDRQKRRRRDGKCETYIYMVFFGRSAASAREEEKTE